MKNALISMLFVILIWAGPLGGWFLGIHVVNPYLDGAGWFSWYNSLSFELQSVIDIAPGAIVATLAFWFALYNLIKDYG